MVRKNWRGEPSGEIRDSRLYRQQFPTFEAYCRERWGMGKRNANQLIAAAEVVGALGALAPMPATERQARPLTHLEPEVQREVWQAVVATTPPAQITARVVEEKAKATARQFPQLGKSTNPGAVATAENLTKPNIKALHTRTRTGAGASAGCGKPTKTYTALPAGAGAPAEWNN